MYVPPEIIGEMKGKAPASLLVTEKEEMTVLFADVRDFTPIAEAFDPQELTEYMNTFLTPLTEIVHQYRGAIDKYMGDAMMAFWGAPLSDPNHALHGVKAAMAMSKKLESLNKYYEENDWPQIRMGIGLGTGDVSVGNMGSEFRMAYTVLGDAVNLGSRLEGLTKFYGVEIMVGETTANVISDYLFRELDFVRVKGKNEPIKIFEPIGESGSVDGAVIQQVEEFKTALALFRAQNWDHAESIINRLNHATPLYIYDLYLKRIHFYRENPPEKDWDGVVNYQVN